MPKAIFGMYLLAETVKFIAAYSWPDMGRRAPRYCGFWSDFSDNMYGGVTMATQTANPDQLTALRSFHPGWFGAVMGTAIVGAAAYMNPGSVPILAAPLRTLGIFVAILAWILGIALGIPFVLRWFRHADAALADLRHPVVGAAFSTFPGGILVLAVTTAAIGPALLPADAVFVIVSILAAIGIPQAFALSVTFAYTLFLAPSIGPEQISGGWFIPPVVNIIAPMVLMPLLPRAGPETARLLLYGSYAAWGMGFFLFLMVGSLLYNRLVQHPLPAPPLAPSIWIGLGPVGVGSLALIRMAQAGAAIWGDLSPAANAVSQILALALWGFGFWWLAASVLLLWRYLRIGGLPYSLGWWAFTFPLGAYTVATLTLARLLKVTAMEWFGALLFVLLMVFWLIVSVNTLRKVRTGEVWKR
jgi:C4-dicarboxylate transporter/malic acid transport protein